MLPPLYFLRNVGHYTRVKSFTSFSSLAQDHGQRRISQSCLKEKFPAASISGNASGLDGPGSGLYRTARTECPEVPRISALPKQGSAVYFLFWIAKRPHGRGSIPYCIPPYFPI